MCHPARLAIECLSPAPRSNGDDDYDGIICTNKCPFGRSVRSSVRPSSSWWPTNGGDCEYDFHRPPLTTDTTHGRVGEWVELRSRRLVGPPSVPLPSPLFHNRIALCLCPAHTWNVADQPPTHLLSLSLDKYMQTISWRRLRRILQL